MTVSMLENSQVALAAPDPSPRYHAVNSCTQNTQKAGSCSDNAVHMNVGSLAVLTGMFLDFPVSPETCW
jgi:hypothetical protein